MVLSTKTRAVGSLLLILTQLQASQELPTIGPIKGPDTNHNNNRFFSERIVE